MLFGYLFHKNHLGLLGIRRMVKKRAKSRFPKEFSKKGVSAFDRRFFIIVLLSLFIHVSLVLYFKAHLPTLLEASTISQIQKRYANMVLDRTIPPPSDASLSAIALPPSEILSLEASEGAAAASEAGSGSALGVARMPAAGGGTMLSAEARLPTAAEMALAGRGGGGRRGTTIEDVANAVGNVGFLSILTAGSGYVPQEYINSISSYSDAENSRLGDVLASMDGVRVSRGPEGKGWGGGSGGNGSEAGPAGGRVMRGTRRESRALSVDDLIGTLQPAAPPIEFGNVSRNESYTALASTAELRPAIPTTQEEKELLRRKPDFVQTVINRHRIAITDCYKRLLRTKPSLKGKVEVRFAINPDGHVSWAEIVNSTIDEPDLDSCMLLRIRNWNDFGYGDPTAPDEIYRQTFTFGY